MSIKVKSGGSYTDVQNVFVKQSGVYQPASVFAKVAGAYQAVGGGGLNTLSLTYDIATSEMIITTNGAGTLVWMISAPSSATPAEIIAGTGAALNGTIATLPGTNTAFIDDSTLTPGLEYWFHAVLTSNGTTPISPAASVRVQQASVTKYATINPLTGSPTIYNYTDANGTWRAYEWTQDGSFEVTVAGDVDYLMAAGGGGGGAWSGFTAGGGGGGAGGLIQGTEFFLATGVQNISIGAGGLGGRTSGPQRSSTNGGNTVALGFTAIGGGRGGARNDPSGILGSAGGSGGGTGDSTGVGGSGITGQGNSGGAGTGAAGSGGGGGGAGGVGSTGIAGTIGGSGGAGVQSSITGTSRWFAAGGGSASNGATRGPGGSGVGGDGGSSVSFSGLPATINSGSGGGGGGGSAGSSTNFVGGDGANGVFILRVKLA